MVSPGQELQQGRYRVEEVLGYGGSHVVYLASMPLLADRKVAIKELVLSSPDPAIRAALQDRLRSECRVLAQIQHPNVVSVLDYFEEAGSSYLVIDFVQGKSLQQYVDDPSSQISWDRLLQLTRELCAALTAVHERTPPIIVGDLKPANVMVDVHGQVRLIDFGLAAVLTPSASTQHSDAGSSPGYSPPEQYTGEVDVRSDIYSLGATLHHIMTRVAPPSSLKRLNGEAVLAPLSGGTHGAPLWFCDMVVRMLSLRRTDRYGSVREMEAEIEAHSEGPPADPVSPPPSVIPPVGSATRMVTLALAAPPKFDLRPFAVRVVAVLVVAIVSFFVVQTTTWPAIERREAPQLTAGLVVDTTPGDVKMIVDGQDLGSSPSMLEGLAVGTHVVELSREFYQPEKLTIEVVSPAAAFGHPGLRVLGPTVTPTISFTDDNGYGRLTVQMRQEGQIRLDIEPAGFDILVDGQPHGTNHPGGTQLTLSCGTHQLEIRKDGYETAKAVISVLPGQVIPWSQKLSTATKPQP